MRLTNSLWYVDRQEVSALLGGVSVSLINDFAAIGFAIPGLNNVDFCQLGGGDAEPCKPAVVLGPGTGLGVCLLVPTDVGYTVVEGEGGHIDFAPVDAHEIAILEILTSRFRRVSAERLLSGAGIINIYQTLAQLTGKKVKYQSPAEVTRAAVEGVDTLSVRTLEMFCRILGSVAGNLALMAGAKGGVYIAGGIVSRFIPFIENSEFRRRFESKGRFRSYLSDIPVRLIMKENLGLYGAMRRLCP